MIPDLIRGHAVMSPSLPQNLGMEKVCDVRGGIRREKREIV